MRKQIILTILVGGLCASAFAQRVEIYGGAQFEHLQSSYNAVGWNGELIGDFKHGYQWFSLLYTPCSVAPAFQVEG